MYESFYGLAGKPFQLNPDPSFYFGSRQHRRAQAYLEYGLHQNEGFIVVTGEVGAGKTTLVRGLLESLDGDKVRAAHLVSTQVDAEDTLRLVAAAFGIAAKDGSKSGLLMALEAFFSATACAGRRCLLIVDEAQNLSPEAVEELRMLSNYQFGSHSLLQSFLVGQPEFREMLQSPSLQQLRQRVIASCHIGPMDREETQGYIEHRLKCAGAAGKPGFAASAHDEIFRCSGGLPRRINALCDRLLLFGYLAGKSDFSGAEVGEVAREIDQETRPQAAAPAEGAANAEAVEGSRLDLSCLDLDAAAADEAARLLAGLRSDRVGERLLRLERSLLRLESINFATLKLLQQLLAAARSRPADKEKPN